MKTIEAQLDDMLPESFKRQRRLAAERLEYLDNVAIGMRQIGRTGLTSEQIAKNLQTNMGAIRDEDIM